MSDDDINYTPTNGVRYGAEDFAEARNAAPVDGYDEKAAYAAFREDVSRQVSDSVDTPASKQESEAVAAMADDKVGRAILGADEGLVVPVAPELATGQDTGSAPSELPSETTTPEATGGTEAGAVKPTSMEQSFATIQSAPKRQDRLVISGDPTIEARFYQRLNENGWVTYKGGVPYVSIDKEKAMEILRDVAKSVPGGEMVHAASFKVERGGDGIWSGAKAAVQNAFGREHKIDVVVVGDAATRAAKLEELGALVGKMNQANLLEASNGNAKNPGDTVAGVKNLAATNSGPLMEFNSSKRLDEVIGVARDVVVRHNLQEAEKKANKGAGKEKTQEKTDATPVVNKYAQEFSDRVTSVVASSEGLLDKNDRGQSAGTELLVRGLKKVKPEEFQSLPTESRQKAIVALAASLAKAESGELINVVKDKEVTLSAKSIEKDGFRADLDKLVATEKAINPDFEQKAVEMAKSYAERGLVTAEQAQAMSATLSGKAASAESTEAEQGQSTAAATTESKQDTKAEANAVAKESAEQAPAKVAYVPTVESTAVAQKEPAAAVKAEPTVESVAEPKAPTTLSEKVQAIAEAGGAKMTRDEASGLLATLDAIRTKPLSSLDANPGDKPSTTLAQTESLLKEISGGKLGPDLAAEAKALGSTIEKWKEQDAARLAELAPTSNPGDSAAAKLETALTAGQAASVAPAAAPEDTFRASDAAVRMGETESAAGKLASMMSNAPGSFTNKDKSWNEDGLQKAAAEVMKLDVDSVATMAPGARNRIAAYSAWIAEGAGSGKLPGFDSEDGKRLAAEVTAKAEKLMAIAPPDKLTPQVSKELQKADNMVNAMATRQKTAGITKTASASTKKVATVATSVSSNQTKIGVSYAKDLVHAVYKQSSMREAQAKYLLKESAQLTPAVLKELDPTTKAQATVALGYLASEVKNGALGDFSKLNSGVKNNVIAAQNLSGKLQADLGQDPKMRTELTKAHLDLQPGASTEATKGGKAGASEEMAKPTAQKQAGRTMDR